MTRTKGDHTAIPKAKLAVLQRAAHHGAQLEPPCLLHMSASKMPRRPCRLVSQDRGQGADLGDRQRGELPHWDVLGRLGGSTLSWFPSLPGKRYADDR
jgi:hypothetical protein